MDGFCLRWLWERLLFYFLSTLSLLLILFLLVLVVAVGGEVMAVVELDAVVGKGSLDGMIGESMG